ncbi:MAG: primosomal protein N' [Chloroflexi bacterium]|nr:primosomal protein N' [Chloroflexota bacterium]
MSIPLYAQVVVNRPIGQPTAPDESGSFTYAAPQRLAAQLQPGQLVHVPFGEVRLVGVVMSLSPVPPSSPLALREIEAILDPRPVLSAHHLQLAAWLAQEYLAPLARCVAVMLPPGVFPPPRVLLRAAPLAQGQPDEQTLKPAERELLALLRTKGTLSLSGLRRAAPWPWPATVRRVGRLARLGLVERLPADTLPRLRTQQAEQVALALPWEAAAAGLLRLGRDTAAARLLEALLRHPDPLPDAAALLRQASADRAAFHALEERGWARFLPARGWAELAVPPSQAAVEASPRAPRQAEALRLLVEAGGRAELATLAQAGAERAAYRALQQKGLVRLAEEPALATRLVEGEAGLDALAELRGLTRHLAVLRVLRDEGKPVWIGWVYAQTPAHRSTLRALQEAGLVTLQSQDAPRDPLAGQRFPADPAPTLTADQEAAWREVRQGGAPVYLLHGVTGSGKTEIYLRALAAALGQGRQALVLVPEIALTPQTIRRFAGRFPGRVTTLHSGLSQGERHDQWQRIRAGQVDVVIGPRSALFAPLPRLGLIVLDEEHEPSYKEPRPPHYHAREAALRLAQLVGATVILGSATPSVESYRQAQAGQYRLLTLPRRIFRSAAPGGAAASAPLPPVQVVDMRAELKAGNRSIFSRALQAGLDGALAQGQQAILFLNRRGSATFVLCRDCGHVLSCPRCELPLTYHRAGEALRCHHCGYSAPPAARCPACSSRRVRYFGAGTEAVEQAVLERWPQARVLRWDQDTTRPRGAHEEIMSRFANGEADILVGTQMLAKGLDLPRVTLVGAIAADTALHLPDFRSGERTFQLLTQVAGRAGRSALGGQAIIQTYAPEHPAIQAASRHDFAGFYQAEIAFRRRLSYPPFTRLVRLLFTHGRWAACQEETAQVAAWMEARLADLGLPGSALMGPAPCFYQRERGLFRWHLLVRAADPLQVVRGAPLRAGWRVEVDPLELL